MPNTNPVAPSNLQRPSSSSAASPSPNDSNDQLLACDDRKARGRLSAGFQRLKDIVPGRALFKKADKAPVCRVSKLPKAHVNRRAAVAKRMTEKWTEFQKTRAEVIRAAGMSPSTPNAWDGKPMSRYAAELAFTQTFRAAAAYLEENPTYESNKLLEKESVVRKSYCDTFEKLKTLDPAYYYECKIFSDTMRCVLDSLPAQPRHAPHDIARYTPIPDRAKGEPADLHVPGRFTKEMNRPIRDRFPARNQRQLNNICAVLDNKVLAVKVGHPMAAHPSYKFRHYIPDGRVPGGLACIGQMLSGGSSSPFAAEAASELTAKLNALGAQWNAALEKSPQERVEALKQLYEDNQRIMKEVAAAADEGRAIQAVQCEALRIQMSDAARPVS